MLRRIGITTRASERTLFGNLQRQKRSIAAEYASPHAENIQFSHRLSTNISSDVNQMLNHSTISDVLSARAQLRPASAACRWSRGEWRAWHFHAPAPWPSDRIST